MGYDLELINKHTNKPYEYDQVTYRAGGKDWSLDYREPRCVYAFTYNYGPFYHVLFGDKSLWILDGMTGKEAVEILSEAIISMRAGETRKKLLAIEKEEIKKMRQTDKDQGNEKRAITDYWMPTIQNARHALIKLRHASLDFPNGVWKVE